MSPLYSKSGDLLGTGGSLSGCCCVPGPLGAQINFVYYPVNPPGDDLHATDGGHYLSASTDASHYVENSATHWYGQEWSTCSDATRVYFSTNNYGCPNGRANILLNLSAPQTINLLVSETRTFQEAWSSDLVVAINVFSITPSTQIFAGGHTITTTGSHTIYSTKKTNTNTVEWAGTLRIASVN